MPQPTIVVDEALNEALRRPENRPLLTLFDYWQEKRRPGRLPTRADIEPTEIPELLPSLFLVDVVPGQTPRFRFRLVGTMITAVEFEMNGRFLDELVAGVENTPMGRQYVDAVDGRIYLRRDSLHWRRREHIDYNVLLLPLTDGGTTVKMLVGLALYRRP